MPSLSYAQNKADFFMEINNFPHNTPDNLVEFEQLLKIFPVSLKLNRSRA